MADIFISYARDDRDRVAPIASALEEEGYTVWWDFDLTPGSTFQNVISENLRGAKCVLVVWSKASINSQWVKEESDDGKRRDILVPAMIDDVEIPLGFRMIQAADLRKWKNDYHDPQWVHLVTQIRLVVQGLNPVTQPYRPRIRWGRAIRRRLVDITVGVITGVGAFYLFSTYPNEISKGIRNIAPEFYDRAFVCDCSDPFIDAMRLFDAGDIDKAHDLFRKIAILGEPRAAKILGDLYSGAPISERDRLFVGRRIDDVEAYTWYLFAAIYDPYTTGLGMNAGRLNAQILADARLDILSTRMSTVDRVKAERALARSLESGSPRDIYRLGGFYQVGRYVGKNNIKAAQFFIIAKQRGVLEAAQAYEQIEAIMTAKEVQQALEQAKNWQSPLPDEHTGKTVQMEELDRLKNELEELRLMEALPRVSDIDISIRKRALDFLGFYDGPINNISDAAYRQSIRRYQRASAEDAGIEAEAELDAVATGTLSARQTVSLIREAATSGHAYSQYTFGIMLQQGIGVIENGLEALNWLKLAADQNLSIAHFALGVIYRDGTTGPNPVTPDARKALFHFKRAAELGYAPAAEAARLIEF